MAKVIELKTTSVTLEMALGEFQARVVAADQSAINLAFSCAAVYMIGTVLAVAGTEQKDADLTKAMEQVVVRERRGKGGNVKDKMLQIYTMLGRKLCKHWAYTEAGKVRYVGIVSTVAACKTAGDMVDAMRLHFEAETAKDDTPLSLNKLRKYLGYSTGAAASDPAKRLGGAIKSAAKAIKDGELNSADAAKAVAQFVNVDTVLAFIATAAAAGDRKTLEAIANAALDAVPARGEKAKAKPAPSVSTH